MSEDWLPPNTQPRTQGSKLLWVIAVLIFLLSLSLGTFLSDQKNELPERNRAMGELRFLFESQSISLTQNINHTYASSAYSQSENQRSDSTVENSVQIDHTLMPFNRSAQSYEAPKPKPQTLIAEQALLEAKRAAEFKAQEEFARLDIEKREREAEAKRQAQEAEAKRQAQEAEAKRQAQEAEAKRQAQEAEAKRQAQEAEAKRQAQEAEAKRQAQEAEAKRQAQEAEAKRQAQRKTPQVSSNPNHVTWDQAQFSLQVKAFRSEKEAEHFLDILDQTWPNLPTRIIVGTSRARPIFRVLLGAFATRKDAQKVRQEFMDKFGSKDKPFIKEMK